MSNLYSAGTPHIQELQNILDSQQEEWAAIKENYITQNSLIAKENCTLKMKLSELENKVSQLIRENVQLRSQVSLNKLEFQNKLASQINVLENGVIQRLEEVLYMFDSIRKKESLPSQPTSTNETVDRIKKRRQSNEEARNRRRSRSVSTGSAHSTSSMKRRSSTFGEDLIDASIKRALDNAQSNSLQTSDTLRLSELPGLNEIDTNNVNNDNLLSPIPHKKRKSNRRKSIYVPELPKPNNEPLMENTIEQQENICSESLIQEGEQSEKLGENLDADQSHVEDQSFSFTNSVLEYSIPEENTLPKQDILDETEKRDTAVNQKKKLEIFHDPPVEELSSSKNEKPPENSITNDPAFITVTGNNKVKHSMKSRKPKKNKGSVDESMPCTQSTESVDFDRPRRTRGKTVDYRLPSLRAKMRRPTEKLVDATTTVNIQDLQVKYKKSKKVLEKELKTDMKAMKSPKKNEKTFESGTIFKKISRDNESRPSSTHSTSSVDAECSHNNSHSENINSSINDTTHSSFNNSTKSVLSDITNISKNKQQQKTKKLLKTAIINDIYDDKTKNAQKTVSFRVNEDDLSVFDLIQHNDTNKSSPKTYRSRSRKNKA